MTKTIYQKPVLSENKATISLNNLPVLTTMSITISPVKMIREISSIGGSRGFGHMTRIVCHAILGIEQLPQEWQNLQGTEQPRINIIVGVEEHNLSQATVKYFDSLSKELVIEAFSFK